MDTNSKSSRFNFNDQYVSLRQPNSINNRQEKRSVMLSPNAPEFVPKSRTTPKPAENLANNMSGLRIGASQPSIQNRLNFSAQSTTHQQHHQNHQQIYHPHQQQQQHHHHHHPHQNSQIRGQQYNNTQTSSMNNYNGERNYSSQSYHRQNIPSSNRSNHNKNYEQPREAQGSQDVFDPTQDETYAIHYVESIVSSLNENPGSFDSISKDVQMIFEGFTDNYYVLSNAMEIIFNKSIEEQNFRYMGAKLYNLLDSIDSRRDSMFRNLLSFKLTYHKDEIIDFIKNKSHYKVRGTTLFLAELYMQLRSNGTVEDIAQSIVFSIEQLLKSASPENIKCICLTLKLAGFDLENDCPINMNNIMLILRNIENMDVSTSRLLESVIKLKDNNWGRTIEEVKPKDYSSNNLQYINNFDEPVFYGPDGQVLTQEESMFLASVAESDINDDNDSEYELNPEMDEETENAFKDFLRNNERKRKI